MRPYATATLLFLLAGLPAWAADDPTPDPAPEREAAVLLALSAAVHGTASPLLSSRDLLRTQLVAERVPGSTRRLFLPQLPPHGGLMTYGGLDPEEGIALLRRLFAAYGFVARAGQGVRLPVRELPLDGFDAKARVGFVLLPAALGGAQAPVVEPDASELSRLQGAGRRILVLPLARYRSMQGDSVSPLLAVALSAIDFLNDVTRGEDVDLSGLAQTDVLRLPLPALDAKSVPSASTFQFEGGNAFIVAEEAGVLELALPGPTTEGAVRRGIGLLILPWYALSKQGATLPEDSGRRFTLEQGSCALESRRPVFVLPPAFDSSQPFRLRVAYGPGQLTLGGPVTLRLP